MPQPANDARFWDRIARKYARDPIGDMVGYERTLDASRRYFTAGDAVHEIGCGTGTTALKLAPSVASYVASDISSAMIAIAREKAEAQRIQNLSFEVGTIAATRSPKGPFDVALAFNLLHLVSARAAMLSGIARELKPGGLFISKTPCLGEMGVMVRVLVPLMQAVGKAPFVAFFNAEELGREIEEAGFAIVERARHGAGRKDPRPFFVARKL